MEAFYELAKSPPTHDFVNWLVRAEEARIAANEKELQIRIVPGVRMMSQRDKFYSQERREWRIHNLLVPLSWLVPSVTDVSLGSGEQTLSYLNPGEPKAPLFKAPKLALEIVAEILPKNAVTITLRRSDFEKSRNSNLGEWLKVAEYLKNNGHIPIFIPDAEADMRGMSDPVPYMTYLAASHCLALKLALYELASMNLMTNSGPMVLALHSSARIMCFKMFVEGVPCCSEQHIRKSGFSPEHDWGPHKHLFWEDDTAKNIIHELKLHLTQQLEKMRVSA